MSMSQTTATATAARHPLTLLSASELAARIRTGEVSSREVVEAHLTRIAEVNPRLNAVIFPLFDEARVAAAAADEAQAHGEPLGPLHGVPITIKDQFLVKGTPTTWGLKHRRDHRAAADGPLVARLRAAGAVIMGKTNIPQLLFYAEASNDLYGQSNNPWNLDRVPGGSSGGEGAIIAAGGSPFGMGADIGGSLRVPAHFCGITTIKPTTLRLTGMDNPAELGNGMEAIVAQSGPMARTVADCALGMQIFAAPGQELIDPLIPPVPWQGPEGSDIRGMRVAMYTDDGFFPASPGVRRAVHVAAEALRAAGVTVEEWTPPNATRGMMAFVGILGADGGDTYVANLGPDKMTPQIAALMRAARLPRAARPAAVRLLRASGQGRSALAATHIRPRTATEYWVLTQERNTVRDSFLASLAAGRFDAIICPPHALPALTHGASTEVSLAASYSMIYNLIGFPGGVVPVTRVRPGEESDRPTTRDSVEKMALTVERGSAGLPLGVQVVAPLWREDRVLALMAAIEAQVRGNADYPAAPPI
jgi:fatty acid amide hydrolase